MTDKFMLKSLKKTIAFLAVSSILVSCNSSFREGKLLSSFEKGNNSFTLRILSFSEKRNFAQTLGGASYLFEVKNSNEKQWKEITSFQFDDPIEVESKSIAFVNENTAFIFMLQKFAVTTDGGKTWKLFDTEQSSLLKNKPLCRIQNVEIQMDGNGIMNLRCSEIEKVLFTKDFGEIWQE